MPWTMPAPAAQHELSDVQLARSAWIYRLLYFAALVTAFLTSVYTFRMLYLTFFGEQQIPVEAGSHAHESPGVMVWPLVILAVCAAVCRRAARSELPEWHASVCCAPGRYSVADGGRCQHGNARRVSRQYRCDKLAGRFGRRGFVVLFVPGRSSRGTVAAHGDGPAGVGASR